MGQDLSRGIVREIIEHSFEWEEWPVSGDSIATREGDALIHLVDWVALGEDPELCRPKP